MKVSSASGGGARRPIKRARLKKFAAATIQAGCEIFRGKGHTNHGVAFAAASIVKAVAYGANRRQESAMNAVGRTTHLF